MNPPIPDPLPLPRTLERGPRPATLKYFIAGDLLFAAIGFVCGGKTMDHPAYAITYCAVMACRLVLLWMLWKGYNWARIAMMVWCAMSLTGLFTISVATMMQQTMTVIDVVFSIAWFWWLLTPKVLEFTKGKPILVL